MNYNLYFFSKKSTEGDQRCQEKDHHDLIRFLIMTAKELVQVISTDVLTTEELMEVAGFISDKKINNKV